MALEPDLVSLKKFWFLPGGHLRFLVKAEFGTNMPELDDLLEIAEGITARLAQHGDRHQVQAEGWVLTKSGWTGVLVNAHSVDRGLEWLELFSEVWGDAVDGKILGAPPSPGPRVGSGAPVPTAYVAYRTGDLATVDSDDRGPLWFVDARLTGYIVDRAIAWTYTTNCRQFFERDPEWCVEPVGTDHARAAVEGLDRYTSCALVDVSADGTNVRRADLWPHGSVTYQVIDAAKDWRLILEDVRKTLLWSPAGADLGFVRNQFANSARDWSSYNQPWPHVTDGKLHRYRPLLTSFVPDVNGIQLLTEAHLGRARDLSGWLVEELPGGRYLVEAPDLAAWYAQPQPDPDVLAKARSDFEGMVLTPELIEANNPWTKAPGGR